MANAPVTAFQEEQARLARLRHPPDGWGTAGEESLPKLGAWDMVLVAGKRLPGIARVSGPGVEHIIQEKKTPGLDGATWTDTGRGIAHFTVTLTLPNAEEWRAFRALRPLLQALNGTGKLLPMAIVHPGLNAIGINSAACKRVGIPHPGSVVGTMEVELEWIEHQPAKATAGTGTPKKDVKTFDKKAQAEAARMTGERALKIARDALRDAKTPAQQAAAEALNEKAIDLAIEERKQRAVPPPSAVEALSAFGLKG